MRLHFGSQRAPRLHWPESPNTANHGPGAVIWRMSQDDEEAVTKRLHEQAREEARREYRRLLYVAMTRARDRLYIGGWEGKNGRPEGCWIIHNMSPSEASLEEMGVQPYVSPGLPPKRTTENRDPPNDVLPGSGSGMIARFATCRLRLLDS